MSGFNLTKSERIQVRVGCDATRTNPVNPTINPYANRVNDPVARPTHRPISPAPDPKPSPGRHLWSAPPFYPVIDRFNRRINRGADQTNRSINRRFDRTNRKTNRKPDRCNRRANRNSNRTNRGVNRKLPPTPTGYAPVSNRKSPGYLTVPRPVTVAARNRPWHQVGYLGIRLGRNFPWYVLRSGPSF